MADWSESLEQLFKKTAEHFLCLRWSHDNASRYCQTRNSYLSIPVIVLSGLAGLGSVGSENLLPFSNSNILVGFVSFVAGTLQTISSYYAFAKRAEAHRVAAIQYERIHRTLEFELQIDREHRTNPSDLIQKLKEEADRLNEISPLLPSHSILAFKKAFPTIEIAAPPILNGLEPTKILPNAPLAQSPRSSGVKVSIIEV
jgi:hypothetical protein